MVANSFTDPLTAAFGGMTPFERNAVVLSYIDGLTHDEIADRLRSQRSTVTHAVADAMRAIARCVEAVTPELPAVRVSP